MKPFKLKLGDWKYELTQDPTSGELCVVGTQRVGVVEKAVEYVKAEVSGVVASVSLVQLEVRKAACDTCEGVTKQAEDKWFCGKCGCPRWDRSRLQVKWEMPGATCPLGKWTGNI